MRLPSPPLLLITDRKQAALPLTRLLDAAFAAGCRWASLREKDLSRTDQVRLGRELHIVARAHGATLTVHGDPAVAAEAGLDGVHLAAGADPAAARASLGGKALIGLSVHRPDELTRVDRHSVDYAIAGPAYATASKPGYGPWLGPEGIAASCAATALPVLAIGGIAPANIGELMRAGAAGIAVMGGVMRSADPGESVQELLRALRANA